MKPLWIREIWSRLSDRYPKFACEFRATLLAPVR